jgi:hypothetical protein
VTNQHDDRRGARIAAAALLTLVGLFLAVVICAPIALSSGDLIRWAGSRTGLGLAGGWPWLVFISLDAAAGTCVLLTMFCAWKDLKARTFGVLVWVFAGFSAFANYRHGRAPDAPADAWWFFPVMSILGPGMLEATTRFVRRYTQRESGRRSEDLPKFGLVRWLPIVGAPKDTYGARRTAQLLGISSVREAVAAYHALCPNGGLRVATALRERDASDAVRTARAAARGDGTGAPMTAPRPPRQRAVKPRDARDARRRPADTGGWWTTARERLYEEYARRLDETGIELTDTQIVAIVPGDKGRARADRDKFLRVRYAREYATQERTPREGVTLPGPIQSRVAEQSARGMRDELRTVGEGV